MGLNKLIRDIERDFERLDEIDEDEIESEELREFVQGLRDFGEEHGFDGERSEYGTTFYAEFTVYEEAQSPVEAQRRATEKMDEYLTAEIADRGFRQVADSVECIDVEETL